MDKFDAQKMLDLYIHDYLLRKNMHTTADILAQEANIESKSVAIDAPEGFLAEWWSVFWDVYCARMGINQPGEQASSSNATQAGFPDLLQAVNPTAASMPEMGGWMPNAFQPMMPGMDFSPNMFGLTPVSDSIMRQDQMMADLVAAKVSMDDRPSLPPAPPPRSFEARPSGLGIDQLAHMMPFSSGSGHRKKKGNNRRPFPVPRDVNIGSSSRKPGGAPELTPRAPNPIPDAPDHAGRTMMNRIPLEGGSLAGFEYADYAAVSNQANQFSSPPVGCQADGLHDLVAQATGNLIISESSTQMVSPTVIVIDDDPKGKGQIGNKSEMEKPIDLDIESFFSLDETPENTSASFTQTLPQSSSALKQKEVQDFPFGLVRNFHQTNNKLTCCDFSSQGTFLAAAGHEKQVFIWNMKQSNRQAIEAHPQLITDVRFKPNSNILATSSFDRTVKIWDAFNTNNLLHSLVGHADQVMSSDFHPTSPNLLCSCDCSDEIRFWNVKESKSFHSLKVRFQTRQGNLLAAASGNVINLIDVETSVVQQRFVGHDKDVRSICWDVCGEYLVSTSHDSTRIWSGVTGGGSVHALHSGGKDFASCTFHPGYTPVVAIGSYQSIDIWNPRMGNKTWNFPAHKGIISAMANSPETNMIASVSHDQWAKLWK